MKKKTKTAEMDDARTIEAVRDASYFKVALYVGDGYCFVRAKTLQRARINGGILERYVNNGRRHMVYAIGPDDSSCFVAPRIDALV